MYVRDYTWSPVGGNRSDNMKRVQVRQGAEGAETQPLDLEDEKMRARLNVMANVAAFGIIVVMLRIGT